jgi:hypothetical protein
MQHIDQIGQVFVVSLALFLLLIFVLFGTIITIFKGEA